MRALAFAVAALALAVLILAASVFVSRPQADQCTLGGSDGIPAIVVPCSEIP